MHTIPVYSRLMYKGDFRSKELYSAKFFSIKSCTIVFDFFRYGLQFLLILAQ